MSSSWDKTAYQKMIDRTWYILTLEEQIEKLKEKIRELEFELKQSKHDTLNIVSKTIGPYPTQTNDT